MCQGLFLNQFKHYLCVSCRAVEVVSLYLCICVPHCICICILVFVSHCFYICVFVFSLCAVSSINIELASTVCSTSAAEPLPGDAATWAEMEQLLNFSTLDANQTN